MKIRSLKSNFVRDGFTHQLVHRVDDLAIYSRSKNGHEHFEVIKIKTSRLHHRDTNPEDFDLTERYPADEN
jgi:hypothetical protein